MTQPTKPPPVVRAVGYTRVSTEDQGKSGLSLDAQQATIATACAERGWTLTETATDIASASSMKRRPELARLLNALDKGQADALVVSRHDRLSRHVPDASAIMARANQHGWRLVICDLNVDTTTPTGRFAAHVVMASVQYERDLIGERTKEALAVARQRGVRLGRPSGVPPEVRRRIVREHRAGRSYTAIARGLNDDGVPTGQGGKSWWSETVKRVLNPVEQAKPKRAGKPTAAIAPHAPRGA